MRLLCSGYTCDTTGTRPSLDFRASDGSLKEVARPSDRSRFASQL